MKREFISKAYLQEQTERFSYVVFRLILVEQCLDTVIDTGLFVLGDISVGLHTHAQAECVNVSLCVSVGFILVDGGQSPCWWEGGGLRGPGLILAVIEVSSGPRPSVGAN